MTAKRTRFTIDMDPAFQKRLKVMAALKGTSMRQYCLDAVERELNNDETTDEAPQGFTEESLERMFALRNEIFGGKKVSGDSADMIREARELRTANQVRLMDL